MADRTFITKRGSALKQDTFSLDKDTPQKYSFRPLISYNHGELIDNINDLEYAYFQNPSYHDEIRIIASSIESNARRRNNNKTILRQDYTAVIHKCKNTRRRNIRRGSSS